MLQGIPAAMPAMAEPLSPSPVNASTNGQQRFHNCGTNICLNVIANSLTCLDQFCGPLMALLESFELWGSPETCTSRWDRGKGCLRSGQSQVSAGWCEIDLSCLELGCHSDFSGKSGGLVLSSGCQTLQKNKQVFFVSYLHHD